eukprot:gene47801-14996_t
MSHLQCAKLDRAAMAGFACSEYTPEMQPECITELPTPAFAHLAFDQAKGLSKGGIDGMLVSQIRALMIDPIACGELTTSCWSHLDTGLQAIPDDCIVHMNPTTFSNALTGNDGATEVSNFCSKTKLHARLPVTMVQPSSPSGRR